VKTTPTGNLPRLGQLLPRDARCVCLDDATGMHGTSQAAARAAAIRLELAEFSSSVDLCASGEYQHRDTPHCSDRALVDEVPGLTYAPGRGVEE
jgi:hypothetical protein